MKRLEGQVAIVTGATQGVGEGIATRLLQEGADVIIASRNSERGQRAVERLRQHGSGALIFKKCDVGVKHEIVDVVLQTIEQFGRLDLLVNNAQTITPWIAADIVEQDPFEIALATGVYASLWASQAAFSQMCKQGGGCIINFSSISATYGTRYSTIYNVGKDAISSLTRTLANEWGRFNIRVNTIQPAAHSPGHAVMTQSAQELAKADPYFGNEQRKLQETAWMQAFPVGDATGVGSAIVGLASDSGRFLTGHTIFADGGMHLWGFNQMMVVAGQRYE